MKRYMFSDKTRGVYNSIPVAKTAAQVRINTLCFLAKKYVWVSIPVAEVVSTLEEHIFSPEDENKTHVCDIDGQSRAG